MRTRGVLNKDYHVYTQQAIAVCLISFLLLIMTNEGEEIRTNTVTNEDKNKNKELGYMCFEQGQLLPVCHSSVYAADNEE